MAEQAINDIFDEKFGANMDVVIEEFMDGEEASYFVCCDGEDFNNSAIAKQEFNAKL